MKIIDETGAVVENPDLTLGYLTTSTEEVTHPAVEGVEEQWHWETVTEYPNGGKDVQKIVDRPGVQAQEEWVEQVPIQKYIRYTAEELAAQKKHAKRPKPGRSCRTRWRHCKKKTRCSSNACLK